MSFTKENIIALPEPHLRQKSKKIGVITDEIKKLAADMKTATLDWEDSRKHEVGVALAAVQTGNMLRVVIIRADFDDKTNREFKVYINPEITKYEGEMAKDYEGCLSINQVYGKVPRYKQVRVKALNLEGKVVRLKAKDFLARIFQHEIDHTNGVVFIDHIKDKPKAFFKLDEKGEITPLDYEKDIKNNKKLWTR